MSRLCGLVALSIALVACAGAPVRAQEVAEQAKSCPDAPQWPGIWRLEAPDVGISGFANATGRPPPFSIFSPGPWNAHGRELVAAALANEAGFKGLSWGYPMMMAGLPPLQFLVTPCETLIINSYRDVRHIYTDGRAHPAEEDRWPTIWGESVGRWEGDTLVIETVSVDVPHKRFGLAPPFSANARYTEKLRMVAPDRIESEITVEDPETLEAPWHAKVAYVPSRGLDRLIHEDFTNDRSELQDGMWVILPPEDAVASGP